MMDKLTLRDEFAKSALQGLLANVAHMRMIGELCRKDSLSDKEVAEMYAKDSYQLADAMLEERK